MLVIVSLIVEDEEVYQLLKRFIEWENHGSPGQYVGASIFTELCAQIFTDKDFWFQAKDSKRLRWSRRIRLRIVPLSGTFDTWAHK